MAEAEPIKEGFLCPICHKDLRSPNNLITHFQDQHSEEQDVLKSIKGFYGKAKKKIFKIDDADLEVFKSELVNESKEHYFLSVGEEQEAGHSVSYTDIYKRIRRDRLDHRTAETNKLIIRLDKLLRVYGSERRQHEQELVGWLDGSTVSRCPSCASSFNLMARQHHCRLCGSIMCSSCSYFLAYETAQSIVAPVHSTDVNNRERVSAKDSESLRICGHCLDMLESRRKLQMEQMMQPIICQLYNHLQKLKTQIQSSVGLYNQMYMSLTSGETTYLLQDAQSLKSAIAQKAEMIDTLSKKIGTIPHDESATKTALLQSSIRKATSAYIKDELLSLPPLPTPQELEKIKQNRTLSKVENETPYDSNTPRLKKVTVTTGWSSASQENVQLEEDPLLQQINIVRGFIEQARQAHRYEEVAALKENLNLLKRSYDEKQKQERAAN